MINVLGIVTLNKRAIKNMIKKSVHLGLSTLSNLWHCGCFWNVVLGIPEKGKKKNKIKDSIWYIT